jgi:hypothetical protein
MTLAGWIIMGSSVTAVLLLVSFCLYRVLTLPNVDVDRLHGPSDIDTGDTQNAD